jgi:hypothetical protein
MSCHRESCPRISAIDSASDLWSLGSSHLGQVLTRREEGGVGCQLAVPRSRASSRRTAARSGRVLAVTVQGHEPWDEPVVNAGRLKRRGGIRGSSRRLRRLVTPAACGRPARPALAEESGAAAGPGCGAAAWCCSAISTRSAPGTGELPPDLGHLKLGS